MVWNKEIRILKSNKTHVSCSQCQLQRLICLRSLQLLPLPRSQSSSTLQSPPRRKTVLRPQVRHQQVHPRSDRYLCVCAILQQRQEQTVLEEP